MTTISCNTNDKMKDISNKYASKLNLKNESFLFCYEGSIVEEDMKQNEIMNKKEDEDSVVLLALKNKVEYNQLDLDVNLFNDTNFDKNTQNRIIMNEFLENFDEFHIKVEFYFDGEIIIIQCNINDKIENIIKELLSKTGEDLNTLCFICNDNIIDFNLEAKELVNKYINNQLKVFNSIKNEIQIKECFNASDIVENTIENYNETHQKYYFEQLPTYIFKQESLLDYESNCSEINEERIPIINISEKEYEHFMKLLPHFKEYSKYNKNKILNTKFICSNKKIDHLNLKENIFFAECSFSFIPYSKDEYLEYEKQIKTDLKGENITDAFNYIEEWVRNIFNIMEDYIIFILYKKPIYYLCYKCHLPNLYIKKNEKKKYSKSIRGYIYIATRNKIPRPFVISK